jgi:hypothetical protein
MTDSDYLNRLWPDYAQTAEGRECTDRLVHTAEVLGVPLTNWQFSMSCDANIRFIVAALITPYLSDEALPLLRKSFPFETSESTRAAKVAFQTAEPLPAWVEVSDAKSGVKVRLRAAELAEFTVRNSGVRVTRDDVWNFAWIQLVMKLKGLRFLHKYVYHTPPTFEREGWWKTYFANAKHL